MDKPTPAQQRNKARNDISRADRARQVTEEPMLQEALISIKGDLFRKFCDSQFGETEQREEIHRSMQNMIKLELYLESVMADGKIGQHTLKFLDQSKKLTGL